MATKEKVDDISKNGEASELRYSTTFPLYEGAESVFHSSDGVLLATRALYLGAASPVFDDILELPSSNEDTKDGYPVIKIEEKAEVFELFLRYVHRDRHLVNAKGPKPTWDQILLLSTLFDKYDTALLAKLVFSEQLPRFFRDLWFRIRFGRLHYSLDQRTTSHPLSRFSRSPLFNTWRISQRRP